MRSIAAAALFFSLFAASGAAAPRNALLGDWRVEALEDPAATSGSTVSMRFGADSRLSGKGPCNRYQAAYKADGESLTIAAPATTRMACPPAVMRQETRFLSLLASVRRWSVAGDTLSLYAEDGAPALRARRM
ncbi:MAG: META domain-containing protein [Methylocystis sp.]